VVEQHLAQVVLHALPEHAGQVNEREHQPGLQDHQPAIERGQPPDRIHVSLDDALVDDALVDIGEQRILRGYQRNRQQESNHPAPMRLEQADDALEDRGGQLACIFFFF
jgi:hypothetical protein